MPAYEFVEVLEEGQNGPPRRTERYFPMSQAPAIGDLLRFDGVLYARVPSAPRSQPTWTPYISNRLPRNLKDQPCTREGKPIVSSQKQEREIMRRFGYERE